MRTVCSIDPSVSSDWSAKESFTTALRLSDNEQTNGVEVFPNPITSSSVISFSVNEDSHIIIEIFDLQGRKIRTPLDENKEAGDYTMPLNREELSAGIYFLKVKMNEESSTIKVLIQ